MRKFALVLLVLIAYILQATLLDMLQIGHIKPNLIIMVVIHIALLRGYWEGGLTGLFAGMLMDILTGRIFGVYAILAMLIGLLAGSFHQRIFRDNFISAMFFTFIFVTLFEFSFYFFEFYIWGQKHIWYAFSQVILPCALYTSILSAPLYMLIYRLNDKMNHYEESY